MIAPRRVAFFSIDCRGYFVTNLDRAFFDRHFVNDQPGNGRIGVGNCSSRGGALQLADIANLAAGFGVERCLIENETALLAFVENVNRSFAIEYSDDFRSCEVRCVVSVKLIRTDLFEEHGIRRDNLALSLRLPYALSILQNSHCLV